MATSNIPVEKIEANAWNPNRMSQDLFENLKAQMIDEGDLGIDPIIVTRKNYYFADSGQPNDEYVIVDGEHRWRIAKELGWEDIRCDVWNLNEGEAKSVSYKRNKLRGSMDPFREAELFKSMQKELRTQEAVAEFFGVSRVLVTNRLAILKTSSEVREVYEKVPRGTLTVSHLEAVAAIKDPGARRELVNDIVDEELSVRHTEARVKNVKQRLEREEALRKRVEASDFKMCPECDAEPRSESYRGYPWVNCPTPSCKVHSWNLETGEIDPPKRTVTETDEETVEQPPRQNQPKSFRYPVPKDEIRAKLAKLVIKAVPGFVNLDRCYLTGVLADGTEISFDLSSDDGVTMSFSRNVYDPRPEPKEDHLPGEDDEFPSYAGRWTRRNAEQSISFHVEPREWKTDKVNKVKVDVGSSDPADLQKVRDFLDGL